MSTDDHTTPPTPSAHSSSGSGSGIPVGFKILVGVAGTGLLASIAAFALLTLASPSGPPSSPTGDAGEGSAAFPLSPPAPFDAFADLSVPEFTLTDHTEATVDESLLDGSVTVMDFFFTSCLLACPGMTAAMSRVADELSDTPVQFASVSVDGETDTPERLRAYAETNEIDLSRWTLMTGPQESVKAMLESGLGMTIRVDPTTQFDVIGGGKTDNVIHPTRLILVGPDRRVAYAASYTRQDEIELLVERARELAAGLE